MIPLDDAEFLAKIDKEGENLREGAKYDLESWLDGICAICGYGVSAYEIFGEEIDKEANK